MIEFYAWQTSNAQRVGIMLEECALPYRLHKVNLMQGEQRKPEFLALNPAGAVPVIVDTEGPGGKPLTLSQSGAIVLYLAEKTGRFLPADPARRAVALQWLMLALTDTMAASMTVFLLGTMCPEKAPANIAYFEDRLLRYFRVANARLADREWLADELSVADFSFYTLFTARRALIDAAGDLAHLGRWGAALAARPAIAKAMQPIA
jgi:GST-like protein